MYIPGTTCLHIPLAHPCLYCYSLIHSIPYCTFNLIAHFILFYFIICSYSYFILIYIYIYYLVLCFIVLFLFILHCPLSGPVLTYISLLIIPCMIVNVTNNKEPWTLATLICNCEKKFLLFERVFSLFSFVYPILFQMHTQFRSQSVMHTGAYYTDTSLPSIM